jgi:hypothetical protein
MHIKFLPIALILLATAAMIVTGCNSISSVSNMGLNPTGPAFIVGTDAPMANVVSFQVQVESFTATDTNGNIVSLITGTPTVDFARYNGLQTLVDMNDLPAATYNQVSITLGAATIGYLNVPGGGGAPSIAFEPATYPDSASTYNYTVSLPNPVTVTSAGEPVGVRVDLDLRQSISVDGNGNFTGAVTPTFHITGVRRGDAGGYIDEFVAAVVTPPAGTTEPQSFVVQGPHGGQFTVNTTSDTEWDGTSSLSALATGTIVAVSGTLDRVDHTFDANEVAIISQNGFYASGLITYLYPSTSNLVPSPPMGFDFYVRGVVPSTTGVQPGNLATVDLTGSETYSIFRMHNSFSQFPQNFFNQSGLLAGQDVVVGGSAANAANASDVTVNQIMLRHWGYTGTIVPGSENPGAGTFQIQVAGFAGVLIPQKVTVYLGNNTDYRFGLAAFGDLLDNATIRVVGLLIVDPSNGNTVLLARHIDGLVLTSF